MSRGTLLGSKITSVRPLWCSKNRTNHRASRKNASSSKDFAHFFCHLSLQLLSLSMLCKNYGIIHYTIGNHTLFGVQRPSLAPQNGGQVEVRLHRQTLLGSKITSVGLPCARQVIAGLAFRASSGQKCNLWSQWYT